MSTATNREAVKRFDGLFGSPDLGVLDELCTPDMANHSLAPTRPQGLAGTRQFLTEAAARFGDNGWSNLRVIAEGDFVVQHGTRSGQWQGGQLFGFDCHAGAYTREVVFLYRLHDGRIAERWAVRDDLTMLRQLGAISQAI
jgi:predicted ester cyclase